MWMKAALPNIFSIHLVLSAYEELCTAAGLNVPQAAAALVELEIFGGAEKQQGERYIAK